MTSRRPAPCRSRSTCLPAATRMELQADAELGKDRNAVVRLMISDRPEGSSRDAGQRVLLGDPQSAGYKTFRAQHRRVRRAPAAELARRSESRRQGSGPAAVRQHLQQPRARRVRAEGEVPAQRHVLHREHGGRRRSRAAEPGLERPLRIVAVPRRVSRHAGRSLRAEAEEPPDRRTSTPPRSRRCRPTVRPYVTSLRAHYDEVMRAQTLAQPGHLADALAFASRAWRRPLTRRREDQPAGVLSEVPHRRTSLDHDAAIRALLARILVSPAFLYRVETVARGAETAAQRLGNGQPDELLPVVVDPRRRAAPRRGRRRAEQSGDAAPSR